MADSHGSAEKLEHGSTVAGWTMVAIMAAGAVVGGIGVVLLNWYVFGIGIGAAVVLGAVSGKVLQAKGYGVPAEIRRAHRPVQYFPPVAGAADRVVAEVPAAAGQAADGPAPASPVPPAGEAPTGAPAPTSSGQPSDLHVS